MYLDFVWSIKECDVIKEKAKCHKKQVYTTDTINNIAIF